MTTPASGKDPARGGGGHAESQAGPRAGDGGAEAFARTLLDVGLDVVSDLDVDAILSHVLESARRLTGARYGAVGILNEAGDQLERFLTIGIDEQTRRSIGAFPTGQGVLGELIQHPAPLRLLDIRQHPRSYGFPAGHPQMTTFLGVPIMIRERLYGNIYLADKETGAFDEQDEDALVTLAAFAGAAINHAQRFAAAESQRAELHQSIERLDASQQISRALGTETDPETLLQLIAKRGRALVGARTVVMETLDGTDLVVTAAAGELPPDIIGRRVPLQGTVASVAIEQDRTQRLESPENRARFEQRGLGQVGFEVGSGLVVPLVFRGRPYGAMLALDHLDSPTRYTAKEERLLEAFASSAAAALATAQAVVSEHLRQRIAAAEHERAWWARELHDETLQGLASIRLRLGAILASGDWAPEDDTEIPRALREVRDQTDADIMTLRGLISELRPAALDEVGAEQAIRALVDRVARDEVTIELSVDLAYEQGRQPERLDGDLENAMYRVIQEALTNARRHGDADLVRIDVREDDETVYVRITDDGCGFDPRDRTDGFGLVGMRERAELLSGRLTVTSGPGRGTQVEMTFPAVRRR